MKDWQFIIFIIVLATGFWSLSSPLESIDFILRDIAQSLNAMKDKK